MTSPVYTTRTQASADDVSSEHSKDTGFGSRGQLRRTVTPDSIHQTTVHVQKQEIKLTVDSL